MPILLQGSRYYRLCAWSPALHNLQGTRCYIRLWKTLRLRNLIIPSTEIGGTDIDLLNVVSAKLGFSYTFKRETYWLSPGANGSFSGSVASVAKRQSLIAMGHIIRVKWFVIPGKFLNLTQYKLIMLGLLLGVEFSTTAFSLDVVLMVPKPNVVNPFWNLTKPYTWQVWLAIGLTFLFSSVIMGALKGQLDLTGLRLMIGPLTAQGI